MFPYAGRARRPFSIRVDEIPVDVAVIERRQVDIDAPIEERVPGGLGLYLVMKMASAIHYEYRDRTSKITLDLDGTMNDV